MLSRLTSNNRQPSHDEPLSPAQSAAEDDGYAWLGIGVVLSKLSLYHEAVSALQNACKLNPQSAKAWSSLGFAFEQLLETKMSIQACKHATELDPSDVDAWHTLGIAYDRSGEIDNAIHALRRANRLAPSDGGLWLSLSRALYSSGQTREGFAALRNAEARTRADSDLDLLSAVSVAYSKNGLPTDAVRAAREVLAVDRDHLGALMTLAIGLAALPGHEQEAQAARKRVGELCRTADEWFELSVAYGKARHAEEAAAAAEKALKIDPKHFGASRSLVIDLSRLPEREEDAQRAREQMRGLCRTADNWHDLSVAYGISGDYPQAIDAADKAIAIDPNCINAWRSRAMNLDQMAKDDPALHEKAMSAWKRVGELCRSADDWFELCAVYGRVGHSEEAVAAAEKALKIDPKHFGALRSLVMNLPHLPGREEDAQRAREQMRGLCTTADNWHDLSVAYGISGDYPQAIDTAEKAIAIDPNCIDAWRSRAMNLDQKAKDDPALHEKAMSAWKRVGELCRTANDWFELSVAYGKATYFEEATAAAEKALKIDPKHFGASRSLVMNLPHLPGREEDAQRAREQMRGLCRTADNWHEVSVAYGISGDYPQAIDAADKAIAIDPNCIDAWRSRAMNLDQMAKGDPALREKAMSAWRHVGELCRTADEWFELSVAYGKARHAEEAAAAAEKALKIDPKHFGASRSLVMNLPHLLGREEDAQGAREQMRGLCTTADNWHNLSVAYGTSGDYPQAIDAADKAIAIDPNCINAWRSRAMSLDQMAKGDPALREKAMSAWKRVGELCHTADGWFELCAVYGRAGYSEEAVAAAEKALKIDPKHFKAALSLATGLFHLSGREEDAQRALEQAKEFCKSPDDWYELGVAYGNSGDYPQAVDAADKAIAIDPNCIDAWHLRALNLNQIAGSDPALRGKALAAWERVRELVNKTRVLGEVEEDEALGNVRSTPRSRTAWRQLAFDYRATGRANEAIFLARETAQETPSLAPYCVAVAEELLSQEPKSVLALMEYFVQLDPSNSTFLHLLGVARLKAGDPDKAAEALRDACAINAGNAQYWYALGKALEVRDTQRAEARRAFNRAIEIRPSYTKARLALRRLNDQAHTNGDTDAESSQPSP